MIQDSAAWELVAASLRFLAAETDLTDQIIGMICEDCGEPSRFFSQYSNEIENRIRQIRRKQDILLDSFLNGAISRQELETMRAYYSDSADNLTQMLNSERPDIWDNMAKRVRFTQLISDSFQGTLKNESFYGQILDHLTVFADRTVEVQLRGLEMRFQFDLNLPDPVPVVIGTQI